MGVGWHTGVLGFQSTHLRGVRLCVRSFRRVYLLLFQSTHLRGVRQKRTGQYGDTLIVSIHAPARGATQGMTLVGAREVVSIHAPARGATLYYETRTEAGKVSIHAPARGATSCQR